MAFKMKGFSGFKSKDNLKEIKDDVIKAAPEYIKKKAKSTAITKAAGKLATTAGRKAAEAIEESGYGIGRFNKDPGENYTVGEYYIFKDGRIGKYKGVNKKGEDDFSEPGDDDF